MRTMLVGPAAAAAIAAIAAFPGGAASEPAADMQAVLKAAQIDPQRPDGSVTPGSEADVTIVEQALHDEGLLDEKWVDSSFGTSTVDAYRDYQESLGYSDLDANGLPGATSLEELGTDRFTVKHTVVPGDRVSIHAVAINDTDLSSEAQAPIGDYYLGKNGLADHGPDDGSSVTPIRTWEEYQQQK